MGLFGNNQNQNGMKTIFRPDGQSHLAFKAGNMTFMDGETYTNIGGNMTVGSGGKSYLDMGNAVLGSDGKTHLKFGDNPTFFI